MFDASRYSQLLGMGRKGPDVQQPVGDGTQALFALGGRNGKQTLNNRFYKSMVQFKH
jgi:hypothetical protein